MDFENTIKEWKNTGSQPPEEMFDTKANGGGFIGGYKPPADLFNWWLNLNSKALIELQSKLKTLNCSDLSGVLTIPNGGTGATTTGKARENLSLNLLTFVGFKQIGITVGEETIDSIVSAMPACSELICDIGASNAKIYPNSYGVLRVSKTNDTRTMFHFYLKGNNVVYYGNYDSSLTEPWNGWVTEYNSANLPIPAYNHRTMELTNEDLNNIKEAGFYVAAGNNTCTNTPLVSGASFGLEVILTAGTHKLQKIYSANTGCYMRFFDGSSWQEWKYSITGNTAQIKSQTYTGNGSTGRTLYWDFNPKIVIIHSTTHPDFAVFVTGARSGLINTNKLNSSDYELRFGGVADLEWDTSSHSLHFSTVGYTEQRNMLELDKEVYTVIAIG